MDNLDKENLFEELSGDYNSEIEKLYYRAFDKDDVKMSNYIYLMNLNDLKLMVDLYYRQEAEEGIGVYMQKMLKTITRSN